MRTHRRDAGFSLSAIIFFATAASILIAAAVPSYQMQAKREMEEELIFRGEEYARAIQKYQRRFGVYPSSVDDLVSTNGLRFLRRAYKDPITDKEFRLITLNPDGSVTGSKVFTRDMNTQPLFGNVQMFGQQPGAQSQMQQLQQGQRSLQQGQQSAQQSLQQAQQQSQQRGFPPAGPQDNFTMGRGATNATPFGLQNQQAQPNQPRGSRGTGSQPGFTSPDGRLVARVGGGLPGAGTGTPVSSSGIIGIASDSDKESIKIYNTRQKYDEWEFIAILGQQGQQGQQGQGQQGQRGQDPNSQLNQPPGGQRQNNPFQGVPFNPITGQPVGPGGPALGVGGSQPPPQSSFGFIGTPQQPQMPRK